MRLSRLHNSIVTSTLAAALLLGVSVGVARADEAGDAFFRKRIEPVLKAECFRCHSSQSDELQAGLRLDSRNALLTGGDSGPAVDLKSTGESLLLQALRHENGLEMPPDKPQLSPEIIADFAKWIELGAPNPNIVDETNAQPDGRDHWAFQPVVKPELPAVHAADRIRTPIDAFLFAALEARGWQPAAEASRVELIRRVTFDLTGLPPTPREIDAFLADESETAFEQVVERLLASPQYGERWGQHWLDVVRYAESEGYEYDRHLPDAWRYRDYVIESLNRDKPYNQFLTEQLAGDELDPENLEYQTAAIFHRLGPVRRNAGNPEIAFSRNEVLTERTNVIGDAILGLTVGCARCHNHKREPISQRDYYALQAYLAATEEHDLRLASADDVAAHEQQTKTIQDQIAALKQKSGTAEADAKTQVQAEIKALEASLPAHLPTIPGIRDDFTKFSPVHLLRRGEQEQKGPVVGPRPLSVLTAADQPELPPETPQPRQELARWLTAPDHPLTARVIVNRVWAAHFGAGIVATVNDFGTHGAAPSHPELLDWLTATFVENNWRLKPLHRQIVLSSAYRQSSQSKHETEYATADPDNRLLWRFTRRRLSAEEIRDAMLSVSGRMNLQAGGPSVLIPVDPELVNLLYKPDQWQVTPDAAEHNRRSIYLIAKRNLRLPFMEAFDAPALQTSCPQRAMSTHAPQALELLNGTLANDLAAAFAERLQHECGDDHNAIITRAYQLAIGRAATARERELSLAFLSGQPLREFALALFNLNGFLYVD